MCNSKLTLWNNSEHQVNSSLGTWINISSALLTHLIRLCGSFPVVQGHTHCLCQTWFHNKVRRCFYNVLQMRNRGRKRLKTIFWTATGTADVDLRVCWASMFRKAVSKPELLSSRAVMPGSLHSQWEMPLPQHTQSQVCCTYGDLTTLSQRNGARELIFLSGSYFLTGRSLLMTWNTVQPSPVSTMLSKLLYFFIILTVSCFEKPYMLWGRAT